METNTCDVNPVDSDALLPPHKRLLAGLKKQVPDFHCEYETRRNDIFRSHLSNPNISNEEIAEATKLAAAKAAETAKAKRAHAEQKAAKAAKAVTAAKCALELVSSLEEEAARKDNKSPKRKKTKRHVPVRALVGNQGGKRNTNCGVDDEAMARELHRSMNSSPRVSKSSPFTDISKGHKRKKVRASASSSERNVDICSGNGVKEIDTITVYLDPPGHQDKVVLDHEDGKTGTVGLENSEVPLDGLGKKSGRVKLKKLPLSVCSFRDPASPKDEAAANGLMAPVERTTRWKCNAFRAPACASRNKVMQS